MSQKVSQDPFGQRLKILTSAVQRLRGWTSSDASRRGELVEALLELNDQRLLGHLYRAAAADAQEGLKLAVEVMLASGPVGPYTRIEDATRCARAMTQLAAVQAGLNLPEAAGRSVESWTELRRQIAAVDVRPELDPLSVGWSLGSSARAAVAGGALSPANAYADALLTRLDGSGLRTDADRARYGLLGVDADRLASDCRWAGGLASDAVAFVRRARTGYDAWVDGRLAQPGRYPPALIERLAEPLFGLYRDLADRLAQVGEDELALVTRRELIAALRALVKRHQPARIELVAALTDLADQLRRDDRLDEARQAADEAVTLAEDPACPVGVRLLADATRTEVFTALGRAEDVVHSMGSSLTEGADASAAASATALRALAGAVRAGGDAEAAQAMESQAAELAQQAGGGTGPEAAATVRALARGVVPFGARPVGWAPLPAEVGYGPSEVVAAPPLDDQSDEALAAARAEAHRIETQAAAAAAAEADRRRAEAQEAARVAAEREATQAQAAAEVARREAAVRVAAEEAEQAERKRRREERLAEHARELEERETVRRAARRAEIEDRIDELRVSGPGPAEAREIERLQLELDPQRPEPESAPPELQPEPERPQPAPAQPEPARPEPARPEPARPEPAQPEPAQLEPAQPEPAQPEPGEPEPAQPELAQSEPAQPEPAQSEPGEPEPAQPDELEVARQAWQQARAAGDRRGARARLETLVELLRARAGNDPEAWTAQLRSALEDLASARLRGGDLFGSRSASREAKALGKR